MSARINKIVQGFATVLDELVRTAPHVCRVLYPGSCTAGQLSKAGLAVHTAVPTATPMPLALGLEALKCGTS